MGKDEVKDRADTPAPPRRVVVAEDEHLGRGVVGVGLACVAAEDALAGHGLRRAGGLDQRGAHHAGHVARARGGRGLHGVLHAAGGGPAERRQAVGDGPRGTIG